MRRKGRDGEAFLTSAEFQASERLRVDLYARPDALPRLGANWVASVSSGRRDGGIADLTDAALAARIRVENAIRAVGPELSGILIDVCCFLKGMEAVEMERGWPVRSAKIVLKTALGVLGRHYNPDERTAGVGRGRCCIGARRTTGRRLRRRLSRQAVCFSAAAASRLMRLTIERRPLARCGVQMLVEAEFLEQGLGVGGDDLAGLPARKQRQHDGNEAAHDMGIRIALELDDRVGSVADPGGEPDLADAAGHFVGVDARFVRERRQGRAKIDDVAIAVFPFVKEAESRRGSPQW